MPSAYISASALLVSLVGCLHCILLCYLLFCFCPSLLLAGSLLSFLPSSFLPSFQSSFLPSTPPFIGEKIKILGL